MAKPSTTRTCSRARWLLVLLWICVSLPIIAGADELRTVDAVRKLGATGLAEKRPVRIKGVVTSVRGKDYPEFTLQDGSGGLIAHLDQPVGDRVHAGWEVEIEGVTDARPPSPRVIVSSFRVGEKIGMPAPLKVNPATLGDGSRDCSYVEFAGVVRRVEIEERVPPVRLMLDFGPSGQELRVWVSHFDDEIKAHLLPGAEVIVRGVCNSWRSPSFQPFNTFVTVADPGQIELVRPAPGRWKEVPSKPIAELLALPMSDFGMHLERTSGVVTLSWPSRPLVLQQDDRAIRVFLDEEADFRLGDRLEVTGFPTLREGAVVLENAGYVRQGTAALVEPEDISPDGIIDESISVDREGKMLRVAGVFQRATNRDGQVVLEMLSGKRTFQAFLPPGDQVPAGLQHGAHVVLTGVCSMSFSDRGRRVGRSPDQFLLQLQDARAVSLVSGDSGWTLARVMLVVSPLVAAPLLWVAVLRRRVNRRSQLLVKEIRARHDAELVAAERMRLAADLHDTLSQSLSGAAMQLEVVGNLAPEVGESHEHLALAKRLLDRGREDLRRTVWDLSPSALAERDLAAALEKIARESAGSREVILHRSGDISSLPERIRVHLFRAGQEMLNNALRHGNPEKIEVTLEVSPDRVLLEICDNGCGFDPSTAPGPDEGHFGLRSLRERIIRLGGTLDLISSPAGTKVTATVPLES